MSAADQNEGIIALYDSISNNPEYLEVPREMPFVETPLHRAASEGRTELALEIMRLNPCLGKKMNPDGLSPLDLALRNGHTATVNRLIKYYPDLIRVQGRGGISPLHYVVETENIDLMIKFLLDCPSSIDDFTVRDETAVHIAVRYKKLKAFKVLLGWLKRTDNEEVLRWSDWKGNTVLHLAALTHQQEVIEMLIGMVNVNEKNFRGKTALDLLPQRGNKKILDLLQGSSSSHSAGHGTCEDYLSSSDITNEMTSLYAAFGTYLSMGMPGDLRNAVLVVIALIATATYEGALTPPFGGGDTHSSRDRNYMIVNTICFALAIGTCFALTVNRLLYFMLILPLAFFLVGYGFLAHGVLNAGTIFGALLPVFIPIMLAFNWRVDLKKRTRRSQSYSLSEAKYLILTSKYASRDG